VGEKTLGVIATYSLSKYLANFDFFNWLVMVQAEGATEVYLDIENPKVKGTLVVPETMRRFHSIIEPGPALAGLPSKLGRCAGGPDIFAPHLIRWFKSGKMFARLKSPKHPVTVDFTVTLRHHHLGMNERDSNREVWIKFAERIGAAVIDDWYDKPIHLHDRMALYAGAKMNFGVCNGPVHLISLTPYPVTMFVNSKSARGTQTWYGNDVDQKYPWMLSNQHIIWKDDNNLDVLLRCFDNLKI
jgi:hypothetical protein